MADSFLVLVANAGEDSISVFRLSDGWLERLGVTAELTGCSTLAVDSRRDLVYAGVKGTGEGGHAGIVTLQLDRETGALEPRSRLRPSGGRHELPRPEQRGHLSARAPRTAADMGSAAR